ncbi:MAG: DNA internalization-related competence protein ComEC/Rec2 [Tenericutes bacterium HGW-Tenericutes-1]|nr:MAG: DNA internalization-related competence protein ComEC/Rec2 [Tenericutes bacterium HGW-Tenericutes-1]
MQKLKTLFAYDAGNYIYFGIFVILSLLSINSLIGLILLLLHAIFLFRYFRRLFYISLIVSGVIISLYFVSFYQDSSPSPSTVTGLVVDSNQDFFILKVNRERWVIYHRLSYFAVPGDFIQIEGFLMTNEGYDIPHSFDYSKYQKGMRYDKSYFATDISLINHQFHLNQVKIAFQKYILNITDTDTASVIILLLFGDDSYLDDTVKTSINQMGISHLFAVSGMHIGLLIVILKQILIRLHVTQLSEDVIILFFVFLYTFLCGFSISVIRASALVLLIIINKNTKFFFSKLDLLSFIMVTFLIINPFVIYLIGFQLSFLITFTILLANQIMKSQNELVSYIKLSLLATAIGLPIILEIGGGINLLVIPLSVFFGLFVSKIVLPGMFISIIIPFVMPLYQWFIKLFIKAILWGNSIHSFIYFNFPLHIFKTIYWIVLFLCLAKSMTRRRICLATLSFILIIIGSFSINHIPDTAYVRILDVGQGDAIHLHDSRCDILIDTGNIDDYNRVIDYFSKSNIYALDYLLLSHQHDDHMGEAEDIMNQLSIDTLVTNQSIIQIASNKTIKPIKGMIFSCGDFNIELIHSEDSQPEENNNSIVMTVEIYQHKWLFTGDMEALIENKLDYQKLTDIEVIKVPHHGSITSSSSILINHINPTYALISVGSRNRFGHPDHRIIERWEMIDSQVLRTDELGTIEFLYIKSNPEVFISTTALAKTPYYYLKRLRPFLDWLLKSLFSML